MKPNNHHILMGVILLCFSFLTHAAELNVPNAHGFVFEPWQGNQMSQEDLKVRFNNIKKSGARHLTFLVFICQKTKTSSHVGNCGSFKDNLASRISWAKLAKEMGFEIDLTLFPRTEDWQTWRGLFAPQDINSWFATYENAVTEVAIASKRLSASHLNLATEMQSLYFHSERWSQMADRMRHFFKGPLTINTSWTGVFYNFWHSLDYISFSAYFPLSIRRSPTLWELRAAWKPYKAILRTINKIYKKPIIFGEIGYMSKVGATRIPSDFSNGDQDLAIQTKAFKAFFEEWKNETILKKVVIWTTDGKGLRGPSDFSYNPLGKPAIEPIKDFFMLR